MKLSSDYDDREIEILNSNSYIVHKLIEYGVLSNSKVRNHNVGESNYAEHIIQPWSIWMDYPELTPWDHDIIKRILRTKTTDSRTKDYQKIIHICEERIRQLEFI
jgi:hypothetical protein